MAEGSEAEKGTQEKSGEGGQKAQAGKPQKLPKYLIALIVVLVIAVGIYLALALPHAPPEDGGNGGNGSGEKLEVTLIYTNDCKACDQSHSFLLVLEVNNIEFDSNALDANTEAAQKLIAEYGLKELPVALVDIGSMKDSMTVQTNSGPATLEQVLKYYDIEKLKDYYIVPEISFDERVHVTYLVEPEECDANGKIRVDLFEDPYCPVCIMAKPSLDKIKNIVKEDVEFVYNYIQTHPIDENNLAAKYVLCGQEQGKLTEMENAIYTPYCGRDTNLNEENLKSCTVANEHYDVPVTQEEINTGLKEFDFDMQALNACIETADEKIEASRERALLFGVSATPLAVVDCKYKTHALNAGRVACIINPDVNGCS